MNCDHDFKTLLKDFDVNINKKEVLHGQRLVCAYCGQVRDIYSNGTVKIIKNHGEINEMDKT